MTRFGRTVGLVVSVAWFTGTIALAQTANPPGQPPTTLPPPPVEAIGIPQPAVTTPIPVTLESGAVVPPLTYPIADPLAPVMQPVLPGPTLENSVLRTSGFDWMKVPPLSPKPMIGNFPAPPSGRGFYSILDAAIGKERMVSPKYGYPRFGLMPYGYFDADWTYLEDPNNRHCDWLDPLKRIHPNENWMATFGGEMWMRYNGRYNADLLEADNTYMLTRTRLNADVWYRDDFRVFAELITAYSYWEDLPSPPYDEDKFAFLNLFVDVKLLELDGRPAYVRAGRQELYFGSQRLVSQDAWNNVPRTFQGVRGFRHTDFLDVDVFWAQPVVPNPGQINSVDNNQNFAGVWSTMRPAEQQFVDLYYLFLDNTNNLTELGLPRAPINTSTIGGRYTGKIKNWMWDGEAALQYGSVDQNSIHAGMVTTGLGYHVQRLFWKPTIWVYYDYASGDKDPGDGKSNTFNQLFPFSHYYLGWADQVGRQNIQDLNVHVFMYPTNWLTLWMQYHKFWLASKYDALYNPNGNAIRRDASGVAGNVVGQELDLVMNFHLSTHADFMTGYSYLFGGPFLKTTRQQGEAVDSSLFFMQLNYRW